MSKLQTNYLLMHRKQMHSPRAFGTAKKIACLYCWFSYARGLIVLQIRQFFCLDLG